MDPVLPPALFDVIDLLATKSAPVTIDDLNVKRNVTKKRFGGIGRVLEGFQVAQRNGESLIRSDGLKRFVAYWENGDLDGISSFFRRYPPYDRFLSFLETKNCINVPPRSEKDARHKMGLRLRQDRIGLTFVAIDTFKWWGMVVGQVYLSHIGDRNIYWGGEKPDTDAFGRCVQSNYEKIRPLDGFVNVGKLADQVCRELKISFIRFEELFKRLCLNHTGYITATSLVRTPSSKSTVQTLLPRSRAKQNGGPIKWTEKRLMEDGVLMNGRSVKMVQFQPVKAVTYQQEITQ